MRLRITFSIILFFLLTSCVSRTTTLSTPTTPPITTVSGDTIAAANGYAEIIAESTLADAVFQFSSTPGGSFPYVDGNRAIWSAPATPGEYTIFVTTGRGSDISVAEHKITVKYPPVRFQSVKLWGTSDGIEAHIRIRNNVTRVVTSVRLKAIVVDRFQKIRLEHNGEDTFDIEIDGLDLSPLQYHDFVWFPGFLVGGYNYWIWPYEVTFADGSTWHLYD